MKKLGCGIFLLAASLGIGLSQVGVEVSFDQGQYLSGEAVPAAVRISNRSGQPLHLGIEEGWLTFSIESADHRIVAKLADVPVAGEFVLDSAKVGIKRVDLTPYFELEQPGHYSVIASVRIKAWNYEATSPPKSFDVIPGAELWEQEFGVPTTNSNCAPEIRKYVLQQANYLKNQLGLYLRVSDAASGRPIRVFSIGRMLTFSRPEAQVDKLSNLHLLYQDGPRSFSYTVFNPSGDLLVRQTYDYLNSRPRLRPGEDGDIVVFGGVRRLTARDEPPLASANSPDKPSSPSIPPDDRPPLPRP